MTVCTDAASCFAMATRGDWHLVDRIVIDEEGLDDALVQDPAALETTCR